MKRILFIFIFSMFFAGNCFAQNTQGETPEIFKVEAAPEKNFNYPYYLYVPKTMRGAAAQKQTISMLVIPNNTGKISDDLAFHEADVKRRIAQNGAAVQSSNLRIVVLIPVFPRPETESWIYTHSLDRDVMTIGKKEFSRLDLQLAAMIKHAQARLKIERIRTEKKVLMQGYSASGMFVNRFVFLHPAMVKAAAIGAPGGWAMSPTAKYNGKDLTFPVGTSDFREISGGKFNLKKVRKVPLFMILGGQDTNDAVPMGDAYDERESNLVITLFGKTPVERWKFTETLYRESNLNATFKLYSNATHQTTQEMRDDILAFIKRYAL